MFCSPFEDLEVGARQVSPGRTVTETDVTTFAALTGDRHPQHTNAEWSAHSPFGERVAHGMLVLSYAAGLVTIDPERVLALRRIGEAVFERAVRFGETIAVETRISAIDPVTRLVTCQWRVRNQDGQLVARATIELQWHRDVEWHRDVAPAGEPLEGDPIGFAAFAQCSSNGVQV